MKNEMSIIKPIKDVVNSPSVDVVNNNYNIYIIGAIVVIVGILIIIIANYIIKQKHIKQSGRRKLELRESRKRELSYKRTKIASILMIVTGILILLGKGIYIYLNNQGEKQSIEKFYKKEEIKEQDDENLESQDAKIDETGNIINTFTYDYIMVLKIPKISFERGIVDKSSKDNTVSKNIEILDESDMPDVENGNLILAGHSGNSRVSFFRRLVEIDIGDEAIITYKGKTYTYKVVNSYDIPKTGMAEIIRNPEKTTLTLITCRQGTNNQVIYILELDNVK